MKKLVLLWLLAPLLGASQTKNVISTDRLFPKNDKIAEFEKALAEHAQKYHTGDWKWRVYDIISGPDAGGYMVVEGPNSWDQLDSRGNISKEHTDDFTKNLAPLTTEKNSSMFAAYRADLSTVQLTDFTEKIAINHLYIKPGTFMDFEGMIKKAKKAWEVGGQTMAVYESSSSGAPQYLVVARYKQGWKERDSSFRKPFKDRYNTANGEDSYGSYVETIQKVADHSWAEMLIYNEDLSSQ